MFNDTTSAVINYMSDEIKSIKRRLERLELPSKSTKHHGLKYCPSCGSGSINTWGTHRIELYCCDCHRKQVISA